MHLVMWLWTILKWSIYLIIGLFSVLILIKYLVGPDKNAGVPKFRSVDPRDAEEKIPMTLPFEVATINEFLQAAMTGMMPGGQVSELPLFTKDGMEKFTTTYAEWAPSPFRELPQPPGPLGTVLGQSSPPLVRLITTFMGLSDMKEMTLAGKRPETSGISASVVQSRIWFGVAPMPEARWKAKKLDDPDNIEEALAVLQQVIDIWKTLATPHVQGSIRNLHNKLCAEIDIFQDACKAAYPAEGLSAPEWNLTYLWYDYVRFHFRFMETQSRAWVYTHLKTLQEIHKSKFMATFQGGRQLNDKQMTVKIDHWEMMILNKIQDMYVEAEIYMHIRIDGIANPFVPLKEEFQDLTKPKLELDKAYKKIENERVRLVTWMIQKTLDNRVKERKRINPAPSFMEAPMLLFDREFGLKSQQPEIDNPPKLQAEPWVRTQLDAKSKQFGFVIYRLSYKDSDEAWMDFRKKLKEGIDSGWEDVVGSDSIREKATLYWVDGRKENISEGDVAATRIAFLAFSSQDSFPENLKKSSFLAITPDCNEGGLDAYAALLLPTKLGDYRQILRAVDATFDATKEMKPNSYDGDFPILDQLIWTDLFAMTSMGVHTMDKYWTLGQQHPWWAYAGPSTGVTRRDWRETREALEQMEQVANDSISDEVPDQSRNEL